LPGEAQVDIGHLVLRNAAADDEEGAGLGARLGKMLFRQGRVAMAERLGIGLLGQIPLVQSIREAGDNGEPVALGTRPDSLAFLELGRKLVDAVNK